MNNPAQQGMQGGGGSLQGQPGGQPGQTGQNQQRRAGPPLYKPEQMRALPAAFAADKEKWEQGLRQLWTQIESNAPETPQHQEAKKKVFDFSRTLTAKMQAYRIQQQQQQQQANQAAAASGAGAARPQSQGQAPQPQEQKGPAQGGSAAEQQQLQAQQQRQKPQVSPKVMEHVNNFPYVVPTQFAAGSPEAAKWINEAKQKYLKGLVAMEGATARLAALDGMQQKRIEEGNPFSAAEEKELKDKKAQFTKNHAEAKNYVDSFRQSQRHAQSLGNSAATADQQGNSGQQPGGGNATGNPNNGPGVQPPTRPQVNPQQAPNPALQSTQAVNAAIEAARNQKMGGPRPTMQQNNSLSQGPQMPGQNVPAQQVQHQQPTIKTEQGVSSAPLPTNTSSTINQLQNQRPMQNSPTTAQPRSTGAPMSTTSQAPPQLPQALSQQAAIAQASRSYSSGNQPIPQVMGHSHPTQNRETPNGGTQKMPIPKHLPERATLPPQPVAVNQARPTYSGGPSSMGNGVISQPVLPKQPGYNMAAEEGRVLSRKKLDELVKQVTGGGHGDGPSLTPEVEESMLTVADTFVDQVLNSACKVAKERGSKTLDIRDIQLTLERGYNIRIPGYASDEIRTVRKIQPSNAWIAKMSAVQAAKVTGGKTQD